MELEIKLYCCMHPRCGKEYLSKQNLRRHINIKHLLKKKTKCHVCNKEFINSTNLKEHLWIHSGSKPYFCEVCSMSFRHKSKFGVHKREHKINANSQVQRNIFFQAYEVIQENSAYN